MPARATDRLADERRFAEEIGDPEQVFRLYFDQIYRYCRQRSRSDADAEDVCAEVFAQALPLLPRMRYQGRPVVALLYTVAARRLADRHRRTRDVAVEDVAAVADAARADRPSEHDLALDRDALRAAISALPEHIRLCVFLRIVQGHSIPEVAAVVGRTEKACRNLVHRGLVDVRAALLRAGVAP